MSPPRPSARRVEEAGTAPPVRGAEPRDVPRIAATLTLAAASTRWARWALPDDGRIQRLTRWHELAGGHRGVATRGAWVTQEVTSVAVWEPPPGAAGTAPVPDDVSAALTRELPSLAGPRAGVVAATDELLAARRPGGPHWWLAFLGTRPSARRGGAAGAVLAPALERCDADGLPAAGAAYSWAAVRYLRGHGFEVTADLATADGAMPVWVVTRLPR